MQAAAGGARKGKGPSVSGLRLGKHGMAVSCKSAAAAATAAAETINSQQAARGRKRKHKTSAQEGALPKLKSRRLDSSIGKSNKHGKGQSVTREQRPAQSSNASDSSDVDNMQVT